MLRTAPAAYAGYLQSGGRVGYEAYQRQVPRALLETAAAAVRENAPGVQVGLYTQAVWQNSDADPDGSDTKAETTALGTGNADTRAFVKDGLFDFVMVKTTAPRTRRRRGSALLRRGGPALSTVRIQSFI